jgi:nucleoside-diphosphate-sugar epimerase
MRIFLTGGTGHAGGAALDAFVRAGHHVDALVRNSEGAALVQSRGAQPVLGDLLKPASYADAVAAAEGAIHAAVDDTPRGRELDGAALDTLLRPRGLPERFVIYTSDVWVLGDQPVAVDENAGLNAAALVAWRPAHEQRVLNAASGVLRTAVIRPGIVYGGARGYVSDLLKDAANGLIRVVGSGDNHWPLIYDRDLGDLYLRIAADSSASGIYHANDEGDERVNDLVTAIIEHLAQKPSVRHVPLAEAKKKIGPLADALVLDQIVRSPRARQLGWSPTLRSVGGNVARLFEEWRRGKEVVSPH